MVTKDKCKKKALAYIRVSTESQGESGVGIEIQKVAIGAYARAAGYEIEEWVIEVKTGTGSGFDTRPRFRECVKRALEDGIPIIVKDISRITRNLQTMKELQKRGVEILVAENGGKLNRAAEIVHAAIAEAEAKAISKRTLEGHTRARAAGKKIGNPEALAKNRGAGLERRQSLRDDFIADLKPALQSMDLLDTASRPTQSLRKIARQLNEQRLFTRHRKPWTAVTLKRALEAMGCDLEARTRTKKPKLGGEADPRRGSW